jgi:hypothetical protein
MILAFVMPKLRKFVRDGQVPVTVVRYSNGQDRDQLEAARADLRSLATAKERAERLLTDAQAPIKDLGTRLAHERLARDEAIVPKTRKATVEQTIGKPVKMPREKPVKWWLGER